MDLRHCWIIFLVLLSAGSASAADDLDPAAVEFFESKIRPVLVEHCDQCHSGKAKILRGGLRLDTRDTARAGGDSGPAVVPGDVSGSLLIEALRYESFEMPPDGQLPDEVIADFVKWIELGAPDPRDEPAASPAAEIDVAAGRDFWAYQPLVRAPVPTPVDQSWPRGDIDRFIRHRQEEAGLEPGGDAEPRVLIRRVYFDLIGLPPPPGEVEAFVADPSPAAYDRLVDRLLDSPRFGERWGRHWLDVARYSDSTGGGRSMLYGESWRYRDYVIDAFNRDLPYDRFITEQIAGDLLPFEDEAQGESQLTATAFLALGPTNYEEQDKAVLRMDVVDEQIDTVGRAFLGMTIGCARCHDHKFDPIPTRDYYALVGIFRSTQTLIHDNVSTWVKRPLPVDAATRARIAASEAEVAALNAEIARVQQRLQTLRLASPVVTVDDEELPDPPARWKTSNGVREFVGTGYRYASGPGDELTYAALLPRPGMYEVRVSYTAHANRSPNALVRVTHAQGQADVRVDQRVSPPIDRLFVSVGRFQFSAGRQTVSISTAGATGNVVADAVQFHPLAATSLAERVVADPASLPGIVVDNTQAELIGEWKDSTYNKSFVGKGYIHDAREGLGTKSVAFKADLPQSGEYEVRLAYNAGDSRATRVPVRITLPGGEVVVHLNQRQTPNVDGLFASVGRFTFNNDQTAVVTVSNEGTDDGYVIADAVQFVPVEELAAPDLAATDDTSPPVEDAAVIAVRMEAAERALQSTKTALQVALAAAPPPLPQVISVRDETEEVGDCRICIRGNLKNEGPPAPRGFLSVITAQPAEIAAGSGRVELAAWIASEGNPLTSRVLVNRAWSHLFGTGLVRTVDNFGRTGETPSHPELLDFVASHFVSDGWSVKSLLREIVRTRTYQLASTPPAAGDEVDPENRLLTRQNRRRLEAEAIYDTILTLSGALDLAQGGNTVRPETQSEYGYEFDVGRRAVYLPVFRNRMHDLFAVFDFPDPNLSIGRRSTTTLSTQALLMMNDPFIVHQSARAAARLLAEEPDATRRLDLLYLRGVGRKPTDNERRLVSGFLTRDVSHGTTEHDRWSELCQTVIGCVDFRYVE